MQRVRKGHQDHKVLPGWMELPVLKALKASPVLMALRACRDLRVRLARKVSLAWTELPDHKGLRDRLDHKVHKV